MNTPRRVLAGLALGAIAVGVLPTAASAGINRGDVVVTDKGALRGTTADGTRTFEGVPYAAAPVGDLRFRSPQPNAAWKGVRDANTPGGACAQPASMPVGVPTANEDCLYLNVTAPTRARDLPVIVWIHPADMMVGAGDIYGAERLAGDAVVVTINYRLGAMGFLTDPSLDSGSVNGSGGLGLEDQQAALRWVAGNIDAFGGDSGNVTLMGESGGGYGVCDHLASPASAGLFDRAIVESAPCGVGGGSRTRAEAIADSEAVVKAALAHQSCEGVTDAAACLRTVDAQTIVDAYGAWGSPRPVSGTPLLPLPVEEALRTGRFNRVPVLVGVNHDEANGMIGGAELRPDATPIPREGYRAAVEQYFVGEDPEPIMARYPLSDYGNSAGLALSTALTDRDWSLATYDTAQTLSKWTRTYMFELARQETPWFAGYPEPSFPVWSQHMAEIPYLLDMQVIPGVDFFEPLSAEQARLAERMIATWTRFAESGNPGWDRVREGDANVRSLKPGPWTETEFVRDHELAFWRSMA
ncbi:carboxylesterase family protein [Phytomonospora sp. NPDC050363]|uniref:carboxylesterase/lipase family protein n=1 Tax=Phytomonospora sp. NPDC050363 TaxID=3155642 RepID=UPI0033E63147